MQETSNLITIKKKNVKSNIWINLVLLLVVILLFFICFEIFLRVTASKAKYNQRQNEFVFYEYDKLLGWKNKPLANGSFFMPDSESYVQINSKGLRDIEHNYTKEKGVKRIEFFGDSFTWGYGVNFEDRYSTVFSSELKNIRATKFEVINLGTTGYGTDQEYLLFKTEGIRYNPDYVIFAYHNDVGEVARKEAYSYPKPFFVIENNSLKLTNVPIQERETNWTTLESNAIVGDSILRKIDAKLRFFKSYEFFRKNILYLPVFRNIKDKVSGINEEETLKVIDKILIESRDLAKKNNAAFIVFIVPDEGQVYGRTDRSEIDHLTDFCSKNNIPLIDLTSDFKTANNPNYYFQIDKHWSKEGNHFVGETLFNKFKIFL